MQDSQQEVSSRGSNESAIDLLRQAEGLSQLLAQRSSLAALRQISILDEACGQIVTLPEELHSQYRRREGCIGDELQIPCSQDILG